MLKFVKSAIDKNSFISHLNGEVVFWGRSNVGKSSLINALAGCKVAKTSSTPGRTQLINYFMDENNNYIIDFPGYGYSKVSKESQIKINKMIDLFFNSSKNIKCVFLLIDARVGFQKNDIEVIEYLNIHNFPIFVIFTKIDKLNQSEKYKLQKSIELNDIKMYLFVSSNKMINIVKLKNIINDYLYQNNTNNNI
ncbi:ribosome biogenesis GTP-binding protein YihA/YsxC [Mycoplasma elephantis]|uniref:ribosome biogenesis GTP-binding protein YihA/YsxC n=1 Tax=Mycoplasma elephantis TaxID=114882 RepID=UPI000488EA49|nr:ribosome biogenesis GTP-binding protein YihA/YsxC [Mycoplasma elephantis]